MSCLSRQNLFPNIHDSSAYFQALLPLLPEAALQNVQTQLWNLLGMQTRRFTSGESSSVPMETAEDLLLSITYTLGTYLREVDAVKALQEERLETLLQHGQWLLQQKVAMGAELLRVLQQRILPIENQSYQETVYEGLPMFLKWYDLRFFAHQIPSDIDYQLCNPVEGLQGVEYFLEYITRLTIETDFIRKFDTRNTVSLLRRYCPDYKGLLINLFDPVFTNALGLACLGGDIRKLTITEAECIHLQSMEELFTRGVEFLAEALDVEDVWYLELAWEQLQPRLKHGDWKNIFLSFTAEK